MLANVYDIGGEHGYKYAGFGLLLPIVISGILNFRMDARALVGFGSIFVLWPLAGLFLGMANGANREDAVSQTTPFVGFVLAMLVAPVLGPRRTIRIFNGVILSAAILTVAVTVMLRFNIGHAFVESLPNYLSCHVDPYQGSNQLFRVGERFYLTATLWLVPSAVYFIGRRRFVLGILCWLGLVFSISKSGALIALLFIFYGMLRSRRRRVWGLVTLVGGIGAGLAAFPDFGYDVYNAFFAPVSSTREIRVGHVSSFFDLVRTHPWILATGQGTGTPFYSVGTGRLEVRMEVDHIDAIRQHGLPWFLALSGVCALAVLRLLRSKDEERRAVGFALLSMYFAAGTNPQLISPLFLFFLGGCYLLAQIEDTGHAGRNPTIRLVPDGLGYA